MSDLGNFINGNISRALKARKAPEAQASDDFFSQPADRFVGPSKVPDVSRSDERSDYSSGNGLVNSSNTDAAQGTQKALKQRQKKNAVETYPATEPDDKY